MNKLVLLAALALSTISYASQNEPEPCRCLQQSSSFVTWVLVIVLASEPYPTFGFLKEYRTAEECRKAGESLKIDEDIRDRLGCMAVSHEVI